MCDAVAPILTSYPQSLKPTCDALADDSDLAPSGGATTCFPKPSLKTWTSDLTAAEARHSLLSYVAGKGGFAYGQTLRA
jgi:hypothetical protein